VIVRGNTQTILSNSGRIYHKNLPLKGSEKKKSIRGNRGEGEKNLDPRRPNSIKETKKQKRGARLNYPCDCSG